MKKKRKHILHIAAALITCIILLAIQYFVYKELETRRARFVSPIFQDITMIRLQRLHKLQGDAIIMGSSITERLMTSPATATIGVPGSAFTAGLELLNGIKSFPAGTTYIIETNNLFSGINRQVLADAGKWDFNLLRDSSHFSIAAKPTNLLLSSIYYLKNRKSANHETAIPDKIITTPENLDHVEKLTTDELANMQDIVKGIKEIHHMGGRVCLVNFPTRDIHMFDKSYAAACKLAQHLSIPILNYNTDYWRKQSEFTDTHHLNSRASSTGVLRETMARDAKACAK